MFGCLTAESICLTGPCVALHLHSFPQRQQGDVNTRSALNCEAESLKRAAHRRETVAIELVEFVLTVEDLLGILVPEEAGAYFVTDLCFV